MGGRGRAVGAAGLGADLPRSGAAAARQQLAELDGPRAERDRSEHDFVSRAHRQGLRGPRHHPCVRVRLPHPDALDQAGVRRLVGRPGRRDHAQQSLAGLGFGAGGHGGRSLSGRGRRSWSRLLWCGLSSAVAAVAPTLGVLALSSVLFGVGLALFHPGAMVYVTTARPESGRALAWYGIGGGVGTAGAPVVLAGFAALTSWRGAFWLLLVVGVVAAAIYARLPASGRGPGARAQRGLTGREAARDGVVALPHYGAGDRLQRLARDGVRLHRVRDVPAVVPCPGGAVRPRRQRGRGSARLGRPRVGDGRAVGRRAVQRVVAPGPYVRGGGAGGGRGRDSDGAALGVVGRRRGRSVQRRPTSPASPSAPVFWCASRRLGAAAWSSACTWGWRRGWGRRPGD